MANKIQVTKASIHLLLYKYTNAKTNKKKSIDSTSPFPFQKNRKYLCVVNAQKNFNKCF